MPFIFALMQKRTKKIKAALASATYAPSALKSSKLARKLAQTGKISLRSDCAPVETPIPARPVISGTGEGSRCKAVFANGPAARISA
jgi:hypothetical protein